MRHSGAVRLLWEDSGIIKPGQTGSHEGVHLLPMSSTFWVTLEQVSYSQSLSFLISKMGILSFLQNCEEYNVVCN